MYPPLIKTVLEARGLVDREEIQTFFERSYEKSIEDPFRFSAMNKIVERLQRVRSSGETVGVYGDFDSDGTPGLVLLVRALRQLGYPSVEWYIPNRLTDPHGFHKNGVEVLLEKGVTCILVVDCGMTDVETVVYARERGIDTIILDHHAPGDTVPPAFAILNPLLEEWHPTPLCGAGCAWKVVQALYQNKQPLGAEKWFLDLAGLATIADMVPLVGENRVLAHYGLLVLNKTRNKGLQEIYTRQRVKQVTSVTVYTRIKPYINSAARAGKTDALVTLLLSDNEKEIAQCADLCDIACREDRSVVTKIAYACTKRSAWKDPHRSVWVFGDKQWGASVSGLIAQKIAERHRKTVFVWGMNGRGTLSGSVRTGFKHNVLDILQQTKSAYHIYGGHAYAAGFTLHPHAAISLEERLNKAEVPQVEEKGDRSFTITLSDLTHTVCQWVLRMAPFGTANEQPCFTIEAPVTYTRRFGKNDRHLAYTLQDKERSIEVVSSFSKESIPLNAPVRVSGYIDYNTYTNAHYLREVNRSVL